MARQLLSMRQAALWLGVGPITVSRLVESGQLRTRTPRRRPYVTLASLEEYVGLRHPEPAAVPRMTDEEWDARLDAALRGE